MSGGVLPATGAERTGYRNYVLAVLVLAYTLNVADRTIIAVLQEPLKREFGWSDLQLGLLGGASFGIFYSILSLPAARLAEHVSRTRVMAGAIALWSGMTALCGLAWSYASLFAFRVGVGVGEAGCTPPAHSLISSYFPPERRAGAIAIYSVGVTLGPMLAAFGGAWIIANLGWRHVFIILGVPGILLALVILLTVREPPRPPQAERAAFLPAIASLWRKRSYRYVIYGQILAAASVGGAHQFVASYFMRTHRMAASEAMLVFGIAQGLFATTGILLSGYLANRLADRVPTILTRLSGFGLIAAFPLLMFAFSVQHTGLAVAMLLAGVVVQMLYAPATHTIAQNVADPHVRATSIAVLLLAANLLGTTSGPLITGLLSDILAEMQRNAAGLNAAACAATPGLADCLAASARGLQLALCAMQLPLIVSALVFLSAGRTLASDTSRA